MTENLPFDLPIHNRGKATIEESLEAAIIGVDNEKG
jgi:hypothetical protein